MDAENSVEVSYVMVEGNADLPALCTRWRQCEWLAVDTEFIRTQTYYPQLGLIQLSDGREIWMLDPLTIDQWDDFTELMQNEKVVKVFHSCTEDLLAFIAFFKLLPTPIFDTQVAATLLNQGMSLSYQNLVKHYTGIELPKGETRSDWMQRPLSDSQLEYAALDVLYLPDIAREQVQALKTAGKEAWIQEEFSRLLSGFEQEFSGDFSRTYIGMKAAWQYRGQQLLVLARLAEWREKRARDRDRPRNWILRDTALYEIARVLPETREQLGSLADVSHNFLKYEGDKVLAIIAESKQASPDEIPPALPKPLGTAQKKQLKKLKSRVEQVANEIDVPSEYLGRRRTLVEYLQSLDGPEPLPDELKGWRGALLLPALQDLATEEELADE